MTRKSWNNYLRPQSHPYTLGGHYRAPQDARKPSESHLLLFCTRFCTPEPISAGSQISQLRDRRKRPSTPRRYWPRCQCSLPDVWGTARRQGNPNMPTQLAHKHLETLKIATSAQNAKNRDLSTTAGRLPRLAAGRHAACAASWVRRRRRDVGEPDPARTRRAHGCGKRDI